MSNPAAMPRDRMVRAYLAEARCECLRMLRSPTFSSLAILMPLFMYLFLGVYLDGVLSKAPPVRVREIFGHWCVFSVMWPGMFGFGASVAIEREQGLIALKRAMPVPLSAYLLGKSLMSVLFASIAAVLIASANALATHAGLTFVQYAAAVGIASLGGLLFASIGLFVGSRVSAQHATGMMYLVYIPVMLLAGLFFPVPQGIKLLSPAFYLDRLIAQPLGSADAQTAALYLLACIGLTILLTVLSVRRLSKHASASG